MRVLVVVPTYNERQNLGSLVEQILDHDGFEVLVVDDQSPDGTGDLADQMAARWPGRVDVLHRAGRRGLGRSYVDGFERALAGGAELVCQMDADFSHDPKYLPDLVAASAEHDLVIGSRYLHGISVVNWPLRRLILSTLANRYIRAVTGLPVKFMDANGKMIGLLTKGDITRGLLKALQKDYQVEELRRYRASHLFDDIISDRTSLILRYNIQARDFTRGGAASSNIKRALLRLGASPQIARRVGIAVYEAEMNLIIHTTNGGTIRVDVGLVDPKDPLLGGRGTLPGNAAARVSFLGE